MRAKGRLIALLTDFGTGDPYVAAMKGVILSVHPGARIVDITHEIPRHDITAAAFALLSIEGFYPERTIFVCVVDPGVGTGRRIVCLKKEQRIFLAPDNGLLNYLSTGIHSERWYCLNLPRGGVSRTFHGRDIFAPAAARLAKGIPLGGLARGIPALPAGELFTKLPSAPNTAAKGAVLHVDRFGNIVTNIMMPAGQTRNLTLTVAGRRIRRICAAYGEGPDGAPFIIRGSTGLLEISINRGHAAGALGVAVGNRVVLRRR